MIGSGSPERELLARLFGVDVQLIELTRRGEADDGWTRAVLRLPEEHLEDCSVALALALLRDSFDDGRPRGYSSQDYVERDALTIVDLVEHLRFIEGSLTVSIDYLRGRMLKTDVTIGANGEVVLIARNRDMLPERWIRALLGEPGGLRLVPPPEE
ncbi:MAG: hypothetical protein AAF533_11085 [Acidobacteriota bacterium]